MNFIDDLDYLQREVDRLKAKNKELKAQNSTYRELLGCDRANGPIVEAEERGAREMLEWINGFMRCSPEWMENQIIGYRAWRAK